MCSKSVRRQDTLTAFQQRTTRICSHGEAAISSGIDMVTEAKLKAGEMMSPWLTTLIEKKRRSIPAPYL